jgi:predicted ATP-grasp superfamily ATP-dependent carboligase
MTTIFVYEDVTATGEPEASATGANRLPVRQAPGADAPGLPSTTLLAEGRAMLDAVSADLQSILGVEVWHVGQRQFADLAAAADFTLVIAPETEGRLEYLANEVLRAGGRLLGPSPAGIQLSADKLALARHWETQGVATPKTWPLDEAPAGQTLVVKPRDGAGSHGVFLKQFVAALPHPASRGEHGGGSLARDQPTIAQDFVPGFAASVAFVIGTRAITPLIPCAQHLSTDGRFRYLGGELPIAPDLAERAMRIAGDAVRCVSGLFGYVGVDVVLGDDGRDWAIEINPRLTTSYVGLRALANCNLMSSMLAAVRGESSHLSWSGDVIQFTPDGRFVARRVRS